MYIDELKELVEKGESDTLEFKKSTARLNAAFETICGFLNGKGGKLLIGVTDNQKIVGQQTSDTVKVQIANQISQIEPAVQLDVEYILLPNGLQVILISAQSGKHAPYTYDGRSYQRLQSRTSRMTRHRYEQLMSEGIHPDSSWELQLNNSTLADLDEAEIRKTISIAVNANRLNPTALTESIEEALTKLELLREGRPTNAAMVLFAESTSPALPQCLIKLARFRGTNKYSSFIDNQMIRGNVFHLMEKANQFIMSHLPVDSVFHDNRLERSDRPLLPLSAIREALSNALCHRDYSQHNAAVTLAIFDDRLEIWNNGVLPAPLTLEDLKTTHQSYPRNKKLARVFYLRKFVETWGTGTIKMIKACQESDTPEPLFNEYSGGFSVTLKYKHPINVPSLTDEAQSSNPKKRREAILSILSQRRLSTQDIYNALYPTYSLRSIQRDLAELHSTGAVKSVGKGKNTHWCTGED